MYFGMCEEQDVVTKKKIQRINDWGTLLIREIMYLRRGEEREGYEMAIWKWCVKKLSEEMERV